VGGIKRVFLVGHTHHDVGYTNSPRIIDRMHESIIRQVLDLSDAHAAEGFRWTFEVARPVLRFLEHADPEDTERLRRRVAEGTLAVTAGYLNNTQLASQPELDTAYDRLAAFASAGIPVRTEQHGDVNGISWGAVPAMRRAGIERLVMALNPDHGRAPFPQPSGFWWEGPDGARIFVWLSTHYGFGEEWGIVDADVELAETRIAEFLEQLAARDDYPYDAVIVHAGNDNRWPTARYLELLRHWNERHPDVRMETATIDQALDVLEEQARAADIPTVRGEWSDWWSHGHGSTAREVAVYREARSFALTAQATLALARLRTDGFPALATVLGYRRGPVRLRSAAEIDRDLAAVDDELLLFNEHTWGSWETYSKPHSAFSSSSWNAKAGFAYGAYDWARDLAVEGLFRLVASGAPADERTRSVGAVERAIVVVNPTESVRTGPVTVEIDGARNVTLLARDVPAFGVTVLPVPPESPAPTSGRTIRTGRYDVTVDPARGGVVSLVDLASGRQLVDPGAGHGLGAVVLERVPAGSTHPMVTESPKDFHPDHPGPEFVRVASAGNREPELRETPDGVEIRWTGTAPTVPSVTATLRLYRDSDLLDLDVELVKPEVFEPESIFVAFPFAIADPRFLLETAGAVYEADAEQLPDTSKDWYSIQSAVGVRGTEGGVLWGTLDAPLVQLGGFHTGQWARKLDAPAGHINSWLMNNLHFTNFQARQDGTWRYRYRFRPAVADAAEVRRFGRDLLQPLQARQYAGPVALDAGAGLRVEPADRLLAELRPDGDGVRIRLRNITGDPVEATVEWDGNGVSIEPGRITVPPHGLAAVHAHRTAD
jgi:alpha-mannosidase